MTLVATPENPIPAGAIVGTVAAVDGVKLRTARWTPAGEPRGTVAVFGGRTEFIEKYAEIAQDLLDRGFAVATVDWRGQGGSERQLRNPMKGHIDDFSLYQRDLAAFTAGVLGPFCPKPWFALAKPALLRALAEALDALGLGGIFAPGGNSKPTGLSPFEGNPLTSDPERFFRTRSVLVAQPSLGLGWPTVGWVHAAFRLQREFENPDLPREITTPTLVLAAGADRVVDTPATERFVTRMRAGNLIVIEGARHEILMERDHFRNQFWAAFDAFVPGVEAAGARLPNLVGG
jgi:lysophospholipase